MATEVSARRRLVAAMIAAGVLVYLIGGIGVAVYLLNRVRKPPTAPAAARAENVAAAVPVRTQPPPAVAGSPRSLHSARPPDHHLES